MKKFLMLLGAFASLSFGSMIGMEALGEEQVLGGTASAAGRGFAGNAKAGDAEGLSVINPARLAFDTKTVFNLNFLMEMDDAKKDGDHYSVSKLSLPSFNLSFPMASWFRRMPFVCRSSARFRWVARCILSWAIRRDR